jgi:dTDP-4-amino-4,6-dideoxygalactose transaminase
MRPAGTAAGERIPFARTGICQEAVDAVTKVLASGWLTSGPQVAAFEEEFSRWVGAEHGVAVSSCTAALELSLRSLHLPRGAPVLVPTITFCGAVNAILHAGLRPVLVDADPDTLMPSAEATAQATARAMARGGEGPAAMVALHYAGHPAAIEEVACAAELALDRVVEDAAHAAGTIAGGRMVGTLTAATCFSYYATQNLAIGEGGMVTTNLAEVADYVRRCRLHGISRDAWQRRMPGSAWRYSVDDVGLKANMTDMQAAIGRAQLQHFDEYQARRKAIVARYDRDLADVPGLRRPARPSDGGHAWHLYVVQVLPEFGASRDELIGELGEQGIECSVHFIPNHQQPFLHDLLGEEVDTGLFPGAEALSQRIVSLPLYPALRDDQVDRVCEAVADVARRGSTPGRFAGKRQHTTAANGVATVLTKGDRV